MPSSPGVYWFTDAENNIIYVGKAKNLNNRLRSYSRINHLLPKTKQLVNKISTVNFQILGSELEALLIEAELIRIHQPHYNILLKDDKSPLYIIITQDKYPKVLSVRRSDLKHHQPLRRLFGPFPSARQVKTVLKLARHLFPYCSEAENKNHKACFYYHLGLCPGACTGVIPVKNYLSLIRHLELFLSGAHQKIVRQLKRQILTASQNEAYEHAAELKTKLESLNYIFAHYQISQEHQPLPQLSADIDAEKLISLRHLLSRHGLNLSRLNRIEAYDVANLMGQSAAVSMVVAIDGRPDHSEYRHFKIKSLTAPNDVGMLKQALIRRQNHPEWGIPDLILIDGGKPQLNGVAKIWQWQAPIISLAKNPDRILIAGETGFLSQTLTQNPITPAAQLLTQLRNEAHRFSRRMHHRLDLNKLLDVR